MREREREEERRGNKKAIFGGREMEKGRGKQIWWEKVKERKREKGSEIDR